MPSLTGLTEAARDELATINSEWAAAMHILRCRLLANDGRVWRHVCPEEEFEDSDGNVHVGPVNCIDFAEMEAEGTYSSGELALVQIAGSLFNGSLSPNLDWAIGILGDEYVEVVLKAIRIRSGIDDPAQQANRAFMARVRQKAVELARAAGGGE